MISNQHLFHLLPDLYTEDDSAKSSGLTADLMDFTPISQFTPTTVWLYPDQTSQMVMIPINPDTVCEGGEMFEVELTNVDVGVLGTHSTAEVTIVDNDRKFSFDLFIEG